MKVIQNNNVKENVIEEEYICEECNSVFVYDDYDIYVDKDGEESVTCPCCGHSCVVYTPVTKDNIEFPKHFYCYKDGVNQSDKEITYLIRKCIESIKTDPNSKNGGFSYAGTGNVFVVVFYHYVDNEYYCVVTKNYFDCTIDK